MAAKQNTASLTVAEYCAAVTMARMAFVATQAIEQGEMLTKAQLMAQFETTSATAAGIPLKLPADIAERGRKWTALRAKAGVRDELGDRQTILRTLRLLRRCG